jgi:spore maturation protein CgeB
VNLRVALFYHSLVSDWNHGNAHFLRGVVSELKARGHRVVVFEPEDSWSRNNLLSDQGDDAIRRFRRAFPGLSSSTYSLNDLRLDEWLDGTDLVIAHEWNDRKLISAIGQYRRTHPHLRLLFHDTHHRALTAQHELSDFDLTEYDGILTYGASLKDVYERHGWSRQVHVWHEAADVRTFYPRVSEEKSGDIVWIGNWGDEERTEELRDYFIQPVARNRWTTSVYGVRYPDSALKELQTAGIEFRGWLPNFEVPETFARYRATVHGPRRPYTRELRGIPTIRPFEALACGIPLVSAPWEDTERLFRVGQDFLMAQNPREMENNLSDVLSDEQLARSLGKSGLETIRARHTCGHRVDQLLDIYHAIAPPRTLDVSEPVEVKA